MISKKSKYAINALVHLGRKYGGGPILISTIAEEENIPQKFLEAILLELKNDGILGSKKGKGGGYYLRREPENVNLAQVLRLFDGAIALLPCVTFKFYERCEECKDEETCSIREAFLKVRNETVKIFKNQTLKTLVEKEKKLIAKKKS
ncbi:RrF2 family transcriptional regulator [Marivirga arenosa]|uniref:Rrf2 family transcriptional regulator n=1 Tax=Marivirga arenosa TaxID=3059076 RepID=A0AA51ZXA0_9BACT|nr:MULTISPECIES: Rrf2 family transcriptional regulator [unclassified Marivirga]WKK87453.1 Rrf2 family transcriptional regulator [Marivirga sp. ABR2-2]WNB18483.1 Rrf2 family transcriptional regulator [Marivirga sp. BKB1-2]